MAMDEFDIFKNKVHQKIGLDLNKYKEKQLKRRISQFMGRYNSSDFAHFFMLLSSDPELLAKFKDFLTINTSEFFRDIKVFEVIAGIIARLGKKQSLLKIWSAGCSVGAEPYSLAILAEEAGIRSYSILASDYDVNALQEATEGSYTANLLKNIPPSLLDKYFSRNGNKYKVKNILKAKVTFKEHNLLKTPYPGDFDLILCRNVFIYFNQDVQHELIHLFVRSLNPGGYFVIGGSEFIPFPDQYGCKKISACIYQKNTMAETGAPQKSGANRIP